MIVYLLSYFQRLHEASIEYSEMGKKKLRTWLGPSPQNYVLFDNGDIVPESVSLVPTLESSALIYNQSESKIRQLQHCSDEKLKRLPWSSIEYKGAHTTLDLTDWISQIKCTTSQECPSLKQIIHLGFLVHHEYLEERNAIITVLDRLGEKEQYEYSGSVELVKR
jgi:hypothetical protein